MKYALSYIYIGLSYNVAITKACTKCSKIIQEDVLNQVSMTVTLASTTMQYMYSSIKDKQLTCWPLYVISTN